MSGCVQSVVFPVVLPLESLCAPPCNMERHDLSELKEIARKQQVQLDLLEQWVDTWKKNQQHSPTGSYGGSMICWRCQRPGHLARNCNRPNSPLRTQPSPSTWSRGGGQSSPFRSRGGQSSTGPGNHASSGGLQGSGNVLNQQGLTPGAVLHCLCMCVCVCLMVLINWLCVF